MSDTGEGASAREVAAEMFDLAHSADDDEVLLSLMTAAVQARDAQHAAEVAELRGALERARAVEERAKTIADEAFGPFPVQTADEAMSCIEQGIFDQRKEIERSKRELDAAVEHVGTVCEERNRLRERVAALEGRPQ